jgi:pSer/pThr/pTyr-binding forkhead associated (FHA) protein
LSGFALRYLGVREGAWTGATVSVGGRPLAVGDTVAVPPEGFVTGRGRDLELQITSSATARRHARFSLLPDGALGVEDLRSTNGTAVNGAKVMHAALRPGDVVTIAEIASFEVVAQA